MASHDSTDPQIKTALALLASGPVKARPTARRVRAYFNHALVVDTTRGWHVWENRFYPQFYVPIADLVSGNVTWCGKDGVPEIGVSADGAVGAKVVELTVGGRTTDRAVLFFAVPEKRSDSPLVRDGGLVRLEFAAMDEWLEEESRVLQHPRDPFRRVDALPSTRLIVVRIDGVEVARSSYGVHLYETGLITRYYLPLGAVNPAVLRPSELHTSCPYKGTASYYHVEVAGKTHENVAWYYPTPLHESAAIVGLVCFYNEKVEIEVDGKVLPQPKSALLEEVIP